MMTVSVRGMLGAALAAAVWGSGASAQDLLERRSGDFATGIRELHEKVSKDRDLAGTSTVLDQRSGAFANGIRELFQETARKLAEQRADPGAADAEDQDTDPEADGDEEADAIDRILPRGAVVFFQRPDCPPPFVMLAGGRGRLVLGSGSGGQPSDQAGQGGPERPAGSAAVGPATASGETNTAPSIELIACVRK